jgi:hypothetical protein
MAAERNSADRVASVVNVPGLAAVELWRRQLANPWNTRGVGIPWGAPMPTTKTVLFFQKQITATAATAAVTAPFNGGLTLAITGDATLGAWVSYQNGGVDFFSKTGSATSVAEKSYTGLASARVVAGGVRMVYRGIADQLGGSTYGFLDNQHGDPDYIYPTFSKVVSHRYYPQNNFDLEFRDAGTTNTDNVSTFGVGVIPAGTSRTFLIQWVLILENNDVSPIAEVHVHGDFVKHHREPTPQASGHMSDHLNAHVVAARNAPHPPHSETHALHDKFDVTPVSGSNAGGLANAALGVAAKYGMEMLLAAAA